MALLAERELDLARARAKAGQMDFSAAPAPALAPQRGAAHVGMLDDAVEALYDKYDASEHSMRRRCKDVSLYTLLQLAETEEMREEMVENIDGRLEQLSARVVQLQRDAAAQANAMQTTMRLLHDALLGMQSSADARFALLERQLRILALRSRAAPPADAAPASSREQHAPLDGDTPCAPPAGPSAVDTMDTASDAPTEVSAEAPAAAPTEVPIEAPAAAPIEVPAEAPAETPMDTADDAPIEVLIEVPAGTPMAVPVDVLIEVPAAAEQTGWQVGEPRDLREDEELLRIATVLSTPSRAARLLERLLTADEPAPQPDRVGGGTPAMAERGLLQ